MPNVNKDAYVSIAPVVNSIYEQTTGKTGIVATDERDVVSMAQTSLQAGYDPVLKSINNVMSKTIFVDRPYSAKLLGLEVTDEEYGDHVRKITILEKEAKDEVKYSLQNGQSVDDMKISLDEVLQTNFYGFDTLKRHDTILRDQLDSAMESSAQLGSFLSTHYTVKANEIETDRENARRLCLLNRMATAIKNDTATPNGQVIHLLTDYAAETGVTLTAQDVLKPANVRAFGQWAFAHIDYIAGKMGNKSTKFHQNFTGKSITRFTPKNMMNMFMLTKYATLFDALVNANTYNDSVFNLAKVEKVDYWQSIDDEAKISVTPASVDATGQIVEDENETPITQDLVVMTIFDKDAAGISFNRGHITSTPMNADGDYFNNFFHQKYRLWNDTTENAIVVVLD